MDVSRLDLIVLIGYLAAVTLVGLLGSLRVRGTKDYFLGGRRFGKVLMVGQNFSVGTHPEMIVSVAGVVYATGLSGIWYQWKNLFATPFYWMMAPVFRRARRTTVAEMVEDRYGPWMAGIYTVYALAYFTINTASLLKGAAKVINQAVGGHLGVNHVIVAMTVIFMLYSFIGGKVASVWNTVLQGFLILALSFMLIPLAWPHVGGISGISAVLDPHRLSIVTPAGVGAWTILMLTLNGLIGIMAMPHQMGVIATGKDEQSCRVGFFAGNYVKRICTAGWATVGLVAAALAARGFFGPQQFPDPEDIFGALCKRLLFPGLLGLLTACILASCMAACAAFMVDSGALFTQNLYRRYWVRSRPDKHYLWVGRISGFVITLLGVCYALFLIKRVLYSFLLTETMSTYMGISFLGGILWRRANRWGALASLVTAFSVNFLLYYVRGERIDHWDANVFMAALVSGAVALVVVSLLTGREPDAGLNSFFGRAQTPAAAPESNGAAFVDPSPKRDVAEAGLQSLLVNLLQPVRAACGVGFFRAYRADLIGTVASLALILALVAAVWLIFRVPG
jgi:Na+/proline symporter